MDQEFEVSGCEAIDQRRDKAWEFFEAVFGEGEIPYFVSDEATLYDIFAGDETQLVERCYAHYGVKLELSDFRIPLWRLLDYLEANRRS